MAKQETFDFTAAPLSVSALNGLVRNRLESGFPFCRVVGEVSNLSAAASGHVYFTLKDAAAQVRCVMFRNRAQLLGWRPENGQSVEASVLVTLYEARGDFQLNVESMRRAGVGDLYEKFIRLKNRLEKEGLFLADNKRPLPRFPRRIGVVTSLAAAALDDVLSALVRRSPHLATLIFPTPVQGNGAAEQIVAALERAAASQLCDAIIICRGGGSIEDLWAFNDENLARAIRRCPVPVITGIGHETDFTIADFAADVRAPTPTAAAELIAPETARLVERLRQLQQNLARRADHLLMVRGQRLDTAAARLLSPEARLAENRARLDALADRLGALWALRLGALNARLAAAEKRSVVLLPRLEPLRAGLDLLHWRLGNAWREQTRRRLQSLSLSADALALLDPRAVLGRGYAMVKNQKNQLITHAAALDAGEQVALHFADGHANVAVETIVLQQEP